MTLFFIHRLSGASPSVLGGSTLHRSSVHYKANSLAQTVIHIHALGQLEYSRLPDLHVFGILGGGEEIQIPQSSHSKGLAEELNLFRREIYTPGVLSSRTPRLTDVKNFQFGLKSLLK